MAHDLKLGFVAQLVSLVKQDEHGEGSLPGPAQQLAVEGLKGVANVHDQYDAHQGLALGEIGLHVGLPIGLELAVRFGIAVAREIDEETVVSGAEEVQRLRSSRRAPGAGQASLPRNAIEHARFARVGASGEGHFPSCILGGFRKARSAEHEFCGDAQPGIEGVIVRRLSRIGIGGVGVALRAVAGIGRRGPTGHGGTLRNHGGKTLA